MSTQPQDGRRSFLEASARGGDVKSQQQLHQEYGVDVATFQEGPYQRTYIGESEIRGAAERAQSGAYRDSSGQMVSHYQLVPEKSPGLIRVGDNYFLSSQYAALQQQQATMQQQQAITQQPAPYDAIFYTTPEHREYLLKKYETELAAYEQAKTKYESEQAAYELDLAAYDRDMAKYREELDKFISSAESAGFTEFQVKTPSGKTAVVPVGRARDILPRIDGEVTISPRDPVFMQARQEMIRYRSEQKEFLMKARNLGFTEIGISTPISGRDYMEQRVVPIDRAYAEIIKAERSVGLENVEFTAMERSRLPPPEPDDPLSTFSKTIAEQRYPDTPMGWLLQNVARPATSAALAIGMGMKDLGVMIADQAAKSPDIFSGRVVSPAIKPGPEPSKFYGVPSPEMAAFEKVTEGGIRAIDEKQPGEVIKGIMRAPGAFVGSVEAQGPVAAAVGIGTGLFLMAPDAAVKTITAFKFKPYYISTPSGPVPAARIFALGTDSKVLILGGRTSEGAWFRGIPSRDKIAYDLMDVPAGTRGLEKEGQVAIQRQIFTRHMKQLEDEMILRKGTAEMTKLSEESYLRKVAAPFEYEKTLPDAPPPGVSSQDMFEVTARVAEQQGGFWSRRIAGIKGSMMRIGVKEPPEFTAAPAGIPSKPVGYRPYKDIDVEEVAEGSGAKAQEAIIAKGPLPSGATLVPDGARNISLVPAQTIVSREAANLAKITGMDMPPAQSESIKLINIVGMDDVGEGVAALQQTAQKGHIFGRRMPDGTFSLRIPGKDAKLEMFSMPYQTANIQIQTTALQSAASLEAAVAGKALTQQQVTQILGGARMGMFPAGHRAKNIIDEYLDSLKTSRAYFAKGDVKSAQLESAYAEKFRTYHQAIDWDAALKETNLSGPRSGSYPRAPATLPISLTWSAFSTQAPISMTWSAFSTLAPTRSPISPVSPRSPPSPRSPISPLSLISPRSPSSPRSPISPVSPRSPPSPRSPVSPFPPISPRSPSSPRSPFSPISPRSPSSPRSPFSPISPRSPPSPRSPISPLSAVSPRSPPSPRSPFSPVSPRSPPSPRSPVSPFPPISPRPPSYPPMIRLPIMRFGRTGTGGFGFSGYTGLVKHAVKNPLVGGFDVKADMGDLRMRHVKASKKSWIYAIR
jgi:tetratricopeptide (TPR) repeat protein